MTVSSTTARQTYIGDGSLATYSYNFRILLASHLVLVKRNTSTGAETAMVYGVDYTVTGAGSYSGGTFTLTAGNLPSGYTLAAYRLLDLLQSTDLRNQGAYFAEIHELVFDRLLMIDQQLQDQINRSLRLPASESSALLLPTKEQRALKALSFDVNGDPTSSAAPASGTISAPMQPVTSAATLLAAIAAMGPWGTALATATGSTASRDLATRFGEIANVRDFGAAGDGVTVDTAAVQSAINTGKPVYFPRGTYLCDTMTMATDGQVVFGDGPLSIILKTGSVNANQFTVSANSVEFFGLRFNGNATVESGANGGFAIEIAAAYTGASIHDCLFSGATAAVGWQCGVKFNTGCDNSACRNCRFERLWGVNSGFGYGVLTGAASRLVISGNIFVMTNGSRGRHAVYLSAGCTHSVVANNTITGSSEAAISIYAQGAQPANSNIVVVGNVVTGCGNAANSSGSSIGLYGKFNDITIALNVISGSLTHGIALDATGYTVSKDVSIIGNRIIDSGFSGVNIVACNGGVCECNNVSNSGQGAAANTYSNFWIASDGTTSSNNWLFANNKSAFTTKTRASFVLNATVPVPTGTKLAGNLFPVLNLTDIELSGAAVVDGRIRYQAAWNAGLIAAGGYITTTVTVPGATVYDTVSASHAGAVAGLQITAFVSAADTVIVTYANHTGAGVTPGNYALTLDVWKKFG